MPHAAFVASKPRPYYSHDFVWMNLGIVALIGWTLCEAYYQTTCEVSHFFIHHKHVCIMCLRVK